ncbi:amino acid transporter [Burkholderia stabilis]|uniref:Amino acid transporter n=1 Tax=Burkholderia stabilis TaxID=95485 RepID=A0A4Q2A7J9_9BURK|nr:amino acid transporter [Burkholderia stabilis]RXV64995.1 amino acid transporter [Burkholderia stabilis]
MTIPDQEAWNAWQPDVLAQRLSDIHLPWCVVGGWALDLWHGVQTREHNDLEFTILREDFDRFRQAFGDLEFYTAHAGVVEKLPANQRAPSGIMQFWGYDRAAERWRIDMMIEPGTPEWWAYKRDPSFKRPRAEMVMRTVDGIPFLNPSAVLLFKARDRRPKDQRDFDNALPKLPVIERTWLKDCLDVLHPGNEWARML